MIEQAAKVKQSDVEQFITLYDTAKGKDKRTYRAANRLSERLLKVYVLCHQAVEEWVTLVTNIEALELKKNEIFQDYFTSNARSLRKRWLKQSEAMNPLQGVR